MKKYTDPKRVSISSGIEMIPNEIKYTLSESLMVLKLYTNKKNKTISLAKINGEILISSVVLNKYIEELL